MKKLLVALSISALFSGAVQAAHWGYSGEHSPEHWGSVSQLCESGLNQSPIDIAHATKSEIEPLNIQYTGKVTALTNNGHTLQATVTGDNTLTVDGDTFELKQFHFHTPSENYVNGKQYPLEAHFVHADKDGNLAVVAVMFDLGKVNQQLADLTSSLPKEGETLQLSHAFPVNDLLPQTASYDRFNGSLTTPPCTEGVRWFVMKDVSNVSDAQQSAMMHVMGHNNRPLQGLHARLILEN